MNSTNLFLLFIVITYSLEFLLIFLTKEEIELSMFIPALHIIALFYLFIVFLDEFLDDITKRSNNVGYKIKKYKGYYYITYHNNPILSWNTELPFEEYGGFWLPFNMDKVICFSLKYDAINFIDKLESERILNKLI